MATKKRLTEVAVHNLRHDGRKGLTRLWDSAVPGFGVYITRGGAKTYFVQYALPDGIRKRLTIGKVGVLSLDQARKTARDILAAVGQGVDPAAERAKKRHGETLGDFWTSSYLPSAEKRLKARSIAEAKRLWKKHILPRLGKARLDALARKDVAALHRDLSEKTPTLANRVLALIRAVLSYAVEREVIPANVARGIKMNKETRHERFLNSEEIQRLWSAIEAQEKAFLAPAVRAVPGVDGRREPRGISPHAAGLFKLLLLTGARLSEIRAARWEWVDWDAGVLALPDSKTGKKRIALSEPALKELKRLWDLKCQDVWIIEGAKPEAPLCNAEKPWRRVRKAASLPDLRLHDLRHSFASVLVNQGLSLAIIGKALGHSQPGTTAKYAHLADDPIRAAVELAGNFIREAIAPPSADVKELHPPKESGATSKRRKIGNA